MDAFFIGLSCFWVGVIFSTATLVYFITKSETQKMIEEFYEEQLIAELEHRRIMETKNTLTKEKEDESMKYVLTGTRAYGPISQDSDWDIVMLREDALCLKSLLELLDIEIHKSNHIHPSYEGFYFQFNQHDKVQVIVAGNEIEYQSWAQASKKMKEYDRIFDRGDRIMAFQNLFYQALSEIRRKTIKNKDKIL